MTKCKGCGSEFRKGVMAFLLTPEGLKGARVCQSCAKGGVLLVARMLPPTLVQKAVRSDGVDRALRQLNTLAKFSRSQSNAATDLHQVGRAEGFEGAIEAIRRECGVGQ